MEQIEQEMKKSLEVGCAVLIAFLIVSFVVMLDAPKVYPFIVPPVESAFVEGL